MKEIKAIIGANYGDEGKGLLVRYFAITEKNPIIIFYQGSNNRGATIDKKPDFKVQVMHFGAGTFDNVPTYYQGKFMFNPRDYWLEYCDLKHYYNVTPITYIDENCRVITPIDELIDHIRCIYRKQQNDNFTSTCLGTNSCNARTKYAQFNFTVKDFINNDPFEICKFLYNNWLIEALKEFNIKNIPNKFKDQINFDNDTINGLYEKSILFKEEFNRILSTTTIVDFDTIYNKFDTLIFESSAGLCLQSNGTNYGTASNTGIFDVIEALNNYNDYKAEACYLTRPYLTKHGIENFPEETFDMHFYDYMNDYNLFQGYLRYGKLNYDEFCNRCNADFSVANDNWVLSKVLTHANSMPMEHINDFKYRSYTPYAEDIEVHNE